MAIQGRFFRPTPKKLRGTGYDSYLEKRLHEGALSEARLHEDKYTYTVEHTYNPDFVVEKEGMTYVIEAKGYFQDRAEASKYKWIKKALPKNAELIFVFEKSDAKLHFATVRRDGTKQTHGEWSKRNGFRYWDEKDFDLDLL